MKRSRIVVAVAVAALLLTAFSASVASASGPLWLYNSTSARLLSGETKTEESKNVSGNVAELIGEGTTIECTAISDTGNIKGGTPGTDESTITFSGCSVVGKTEAECHVDGKGETGNKIVVKAKTELVYIGTETEAKKEEGPIGDLFSPLSGTTFVTLELAGTNCFTSGAVKVKGSVVAKTSPGPGVIALWPRLIFPNPSIKKAFKWESAGKVKEVDPALTAFGVSENIQVGEEEVMLNESANLEFGVSDT